MDAAVDIEIRLLGRPRVLAGGRDVVLPKSRKARALLAMLALEPGEHPRGALCEQIWPDTADPRADLRWGLSKLRSILGAEAVIASTASVSLNPERVAVDVWQLEALLEDSEQTSTDALRTFVERFSGAVLEGLDARVGVEFELWLESRRESLRRLHERLLANLIGRLGDRPEEALTLARQRVAINPLSESANETLLRLTLTAAGRQRAQADLEQARQRLRDAGLPEAGLLAAWRRMNVPANSAAPAVASAAADASMVAESVAEAMQAPQKPSVAVLGFDDLGDPDAMLAEGLAVDLTGQLGRLKGLFVIARASARRFRLGTQTAHEIGIRLGVRYLIQGSIQRRNKRLRVNVELLECEHGEEVWSERFERPFDDLFDVQDQIVDAVVAALEPQIEQAERNRARWIPAGDLNAWECFHRAMWHGYRFTHADIAEAEQWLRRALAQDPNFARAYAGLSFNYFSRVFLLASADPDGDSKRALEFASESVRLEPRDGFGHWSLGRAHFLTRNHDAALSSIDRALVVNPNYAQGHYARGFVGCHASLTDLANSDLDMAQRLSPFDPLRFAMEACRAISLAVTGDHGGAADWALRATHEPNAHFHIFAIAAACLQLAGRAEQAAGCVTQVLQRHPSYSVGEWERSFPHKSDRDRHVFSEALRRAGLPARK